MATKIIAPNKGVQKFLRTDELDQPNPIQAEISGLSL